MKIIDAIFADWKGGLAAGKIAAKYGLTREQAYAILACSVGLTTEQIAQRLPRVCKGLRTAEIWAVMNPPDNVPVEEVG